jgi:hypothetical protein
MSIPAQAHTRGAPSRSSLFYVSRATMVCTSILILILMLGCLLTVSAFVVDQRVDAIGSVSFHPLQPSVLSVSGSRHWGTSDTSGEEADLGACSSSASDSDSDSDSSSDSEDTSPSVTPFRHRGPSTQDATIKFWSFSAESG